MIPASHPPGLPYIIANEAAERFSYYGMRAVLVVFMTTHLLAPNGTPAPMSEVEAVFWYHTFTSANYFFPIVGAFIADVWLGKYRTIIYLSLVYTLGHVALSVDDSRVGLFAGLTLIAVGAGGIKPCVSAHLGDQYTPAQSALVSHGYSFFYLAINVGAAVASLLIPYLYHHYGPATAFLIPGLLMALATLAFWLGRSTYRSIPAMGLATFRDARGQSSRLVSLLLVFFVLAIFWSLYDQTGSSWVVQAAKMDTVLLTGTSLEIMVLPEQIQSLNPILVLILTPSLTLWGYPGLSRIMIVTARRKMAIGIALAGVSFLVTGYAQYLIDAGARPSISLQACAYVLLTTAEVMVSITSLEYAYTQAPSSLKSLCMGCYLLSVSLGNAVTALVNYVLSQPSFAGSLRGSDYFFFFAGLGFVGGIVMIFLPSIRDDNPILVAADSGIYEKN